MSAFFYINEKALWQTDSLSIRELFLLTSLREELGVNNLKSLLIHQSAGTLLLKKREDYHPIKASSMVEAFALEFHSTKHYCSTQKQEPRRAFCRLSQADCLKKGKGRVFPHQGWPASIKWKQLPACVLSQLIEQSVNNATVRGSIPCSWGHPRP